MVDFPLSIIRRAMLVKPPSFLFPSSHLSSARETHNVISAITLIITHYIIINISVVAVVADVSFSSSHEVFPLTLTSSHLLLLLPFASLERDARVRGLPFHVRSPNMLNMLRAVMCVVNRLACDLKSFSVQFEYYFRFMLYASRERGRCIERE